MALAILDNLQSLDLDSKATFANATDSFGNAQQSVTKDLGGSSAFNLDTTGLMGEFDAAAQVVNGTGSSAVPAAPFSVGELQSQVTGRLDELGGLNAEGLQQAIPANPGMESFKNLSITRDVNSTVSGLTSAITGNTNFATVDLPTSTNSPFTEFQEFLNNAGALPSRVLDAIITVFKKFLDKLEHPDAWLGELSGEALTEIFVEQIREVTQLLPSQAIALATTSLNQRSTLITDYQTFLTTLDPKTLDRAKITERRQQVKLWLRQVETSSQQLDTALSNLQTFKLDTFQQLLANFPQGEPGAGTLSTLFEGIQTFVQGLEGRITDVTAQLQTFIDQIKRLFEQAIEKVGEVANTVVKTISDKIELAGKALDKVVAYLQEAIAKLQEFVQKACDQSDQMIRPLKSACNQFSDKAVGGIEALATTIRQQTQRFQQQIEKANQTIESQLNREQLEQKIRDLLGKVTGVLESPAVNDALKTAEGGIDQIIEALKKLSLDPAFKLAVDKTGELEAKLKTVNVAQLGTAQKAALKVGVKIIQQVDVPGTVNPELVAAFDQVLDPVVNLVTSVQAEIGQIDAKVNEFEPGTLAANALAPLIDKLVAELNKYKPSIVLAKVKELYETLLDKLEALNPNQLLDLLEQLYQKLVDVIEALSPKKLTDFLNSKLKDVTDALDKIPVRQVVNKVIDSIGNVEKLLGGLGIDSLLNSSFWKTLEDVLSISLQDKIQKVDEIKAKVVERVNAINEAALRTELTQFRAALDQYAADPQAAVQTALTAMEAAFTSYQQSAQALQTTWTEQRDRLHTFTPPTEWAFDYQDLLRRLELLTTALTTLEPTQAQVTQLTTQVQGMLPTLSVSPAATPDTPAKTTRTRGKTTKSQAASSPAADTSSATAEGSSESAEPSATESSASSTTSRLTLTLAATDTQIIAAFKQVIPDEIERELTGPIKDILSSMDRILALPRALLADIKSVLQLLRDLPERLGAILKGVASSLGTVLEGAIAKIKSSIAAFNVNFINDIHRQIVEKVKELSPLQVLNSFYDVSDFAGGSVAAFLARLRNAGTTDEVSRYILSQHFDKPQQDLILTADSDGAQKALIQGLNRLLKDERFYTPDRFKDILLSDEARRLIDTNNRSLKETIRLNRLLLEAIYPQELTLSLQSIYPFFLDKLRGLYPDDLVETLDQLHAKVVQVIRDFPLALKDALNAEYQKVIVLYDRIKAQIDKIFEALKAQLRALQSQLNIGLEDVGDAFGRLLVALPV